MRKFEKAKIVSLVETLKDANIRVGLLVKSHNYEEVYEVLVACQEGALYIGSTIEKEETDTKEVIAELESYCENIYCISINLDNDNYDFGLAFKILDNQLDYIQKFIQNQIRVKYEIVFLPYKAAMWDSLESIWKAANQDPDCKCYVIPISYYEIITGNSSAILKYEGTMMPKYVPITSYKSYNFEDRKPDIIYIHNPFDQYNKLTSVKSEFYSFELKKYTEHLVYVPYFVTGGSLPKSFEYLPSYNYIDKLVIQSNKLIKFYKKNVSLEKIIDLGSPKVDKIYSVHNQKNEIPKEWSSIIKDKRVIFYNTSLSSFFEHGEKALEKMEYVFSCFRNREREILLWRPHPLTKPTLQAMNSEIYQKYCDLEKKFNIYNIGILDMTADITLSIAISDAYIGEETSSIVHLFGVIGKPIFLLDIGICQKTEEQRNNLVGGLDVCIEDGELWFVHCYYNALCKMNMDTGEVEIIDKIPKELLSEERLYHDILKIDNKLYFAPHRAKQMAEYDLNSKEFNKIALRKTIQDNKSKYTRMVRYKDYLFLLPTHYPAIVRYNLKNNSFEYYWNVINDLKKYSKGDNLNIAEFMNAIYVEGNLLLAASARSNTILEFNMDTKKNNIYTVGKEGNNYYRMDYDGNDYWLIPNESKSIVRWNRKSGKTLEYTEFPDGFEGDKNAFLSIIYCGEYMLAFPKNANMIVKIDIESGRMSEFKLYLPYEEGKRKEQYYNWPNNYYFVKKIDDAHILAMTAYDSSLLVINTVNQEYCLKKCIIKKRKIILKFGNCGDNLPYACKEDTYVTIEDFLIWMEEKQLFNPEEQKKAYRAIVNNMDGSCGSKVHNYMMRQLIREEL